jgi:hypothetical protein
MPTPLEESIRAEHRRAVRGCAIWGVVVPVSTLPLVVLGPIVGVPLFSLAAFLAVRTRSGVGRPFAYGAYHWRLVTEAFRDAARPALIVGALAAAATATHRAAPRSPGAAVVAVALGVVSVFTTMYALGVPREVVFDHTVELLLERRAAQRIRHETSLLLMRRAEDVDRRAVALFGESLIGAAVESMPPFAAPFDDPAESTDALDRFAALADSFAADADAELAGALREMASAAAEAKAEGLRRRLVTVPPYPTAQALDLMGSTVGYA